MAEVRVPGAKLTLGGREYVIAPLKLSQLKLLENELLRMDPSSPDAAKTTSERMDIVAHIVRESLSRNYESVYGEDGKQVGLSDAAVLDLLDASNWLTALNLALYTSGLRQGEGTPAMGSVSDTSIAGSPQLMDGLTPRSASTH